MRQFCKFISRKYAGGLPMGKSTVHYKLTEESKKLPLYCNLMHNWDLSKWNRVCGSRKTFRLDTHLWLFPKRSKQNHPLSEKEIETEDKDNLQNLNEVDSKSYRKEAKWGPQVHLAENRHYWILESGDLPTVTQTDHSR